VVKFGKVVVFWTSPRNPKRKRGSAVRPRSRFALTIQIAKLYHDRKLRHVAFTISQDRLGPSKGGASPIDETTAIGDAHRPRRCLLGPTWGAATSKTMCGPRCTRFILPTIND
jgi:hypothetical protein